MDAATRTWARSRVRLCGGLALEIDGEQRALPGGQPAHLVAFLVTRPGRTARREALIDLLWPADPPQDPQGALRPILSRLRRTLAPATLEGREQLRLDLPEPVSIDADDAAAHLQAARDAARDDRWDDARAAAGAAGELLGAPLLPGIDADWARELRDDVEELRLEALEWQARAALRTGDTGAAERTGRALVARAPFRETGHRFLMEALAAAGNVAEALRVYDDLRVRLREELGTTPAPEVQALHQRLLTGETAVIAPEPEHVPLPSWLAPRSGAPLVARRDELDRLRGAWQAAKRDGGRLVLVAGEPGIGKTRLTSEFAREIAGAASVLHAACPEERLVSYQPFIEALRGTDVDWDAIVAAAGEAEDPEMRRYRVFDEVARRLRELAGRAPVALVFDDLHWADPATLQLLRHVVRAARDVPLLVAGTYRDAETGPALAELVADLRRDGLVERVTLPGLAVADVGALIAAQAGHAAPPALVEAVHAHTDGNPFFVGEVLHHLIETGVVFERGGRWTSALTPDEIGVPEGVRDVLARRLSRTSDGCRAALAAASVLGREWSFDLLREMDAAPADALLEAVEEAREAQLTVEVERGGVAAYAFTHALVREVLYGGLSVPRRQRLHAAAAQALERLSGEERLAELALHHRLAGSAGDAERAVDCSLRAARQAADRSAWEESAAHLEGAIEAMARVGGRDRERADALVTLADLMVVTGDLGRRIANLERALALYEQLGDEQRGARAHSRLALARSMMDSIYAEHMDVGRAARHLEAARPVLAAGRPGRALGHFELGVANVHMYGVDVAPGLEAAARAMDVAQAHGDELLWASSAITFAWHTLSSGRPGEGLAVLDRAHEAAQRHARPFLAFMAGSVHGQLTWGLGAPDDAQRTFERLAAMPHVGDVAYRQQIADSIGRCHASRGEWEQARARVADAKPTWFSHSLAPLVDLWDGRLDDVIALAGSVLDTSRRVGNRWDEWAALHLLGRAHLARGDAAGALAPLEAAREITSRGGAAYWELWVLPDLARALIGLGRLDEAGAHVERSRVITSGEDWRGRVGIAGIAEGALLAATGEAPAAELAFARAREALRRERLRCDELDLLEVWGAGLGAPERRAEAAELRAQIG